MSLFLGTLSPEQEIIGELRVSNRTVRYLARVDSLIERQALLLGRYEPAESAVIDRYVKPGMTCLDIGANVGLHTLRMAAIASRVYAFEPNPEVRERNWENLQLNGISNVELLPFGLSDKNGEATLWRSQGSNRNSTLVDDHETADVVRTPLTIEIRTIDSLPISRPVHFIKLDVEGYELPALKGALAVLREDRPIILTEYNQYFASKVGYSEADLRSFLSGYSCERISSDGLLFTPDSSIR